MAFDIGLIVFVLECITNNIFHIYARYYVKWEEQEQDEELGKVDVGSYVIQDIIEFSRIFFGLLLIAVSFYQHRILVSPTGKYCTKHGAPLNFEGEWLRNILRLQLSKSIIFTIWQVYSYKLDVKYRQKQQEQ